MKGLHKVIVQNNRLHYEFDIKRNITIIQGNSATGKTTLINMLRQAENLGADSGVDVNCDVPCRILEGRNWKVILRVFQRALFLLMKKILLLIQRNSHLQFRIQIIIMC